MLDGAAPHGAPVRSLAPPTGRDQAGVPWGATATTVAAAATAAGRDRRAVAAAAAATTAAATATATKQQAATKPCALGCGTARRWSSARLVVRPSGWLRC